MKNKILISFMAIMCLMLTAQDGYTRILHKRSEGNILEELSSAVAFPHKRSEITIVDEDSRYALGLKEIRQQEKSLQKKIQKEKTLPFNNILKEEKTLLQYNDEIIAAFHLQKESMIPESIIASKKQNYEVLLNLANDTNPNFLSAHRRKVLKNIISAPQPHVTNHVRTKAYFTLADLLEKPKDTSSQAAHLKILEKAAAYAEDTGLEKAAARKYIKAASEMGVLASLPAASFARVMQYEVNIHPQNAQWVREQKIERSHAQKQTMNNLIAQNKQEIILKSLRAQLAADPMRQSYVTYVDQIQAHFPTIQASFIEALFTLKQSQKHSPKVSKAKLRNAQRFFRACLQITLQSQDSAPVKKDALGYIFDQNKPWYTLIPSDMLAQASYLNSIL